MPTHKQIITVLGVRLRTALTILAFAVAVSLCAGTAEAGCMAAPTPELRRLADLAATKPLAVLAGTERVKFDDPSVGWRLAARAEAYDVLSRPAGARRTALAALQPGQRLSEALRTELLTRYAINGFREVEIRQATKRVEAARRQLVRGSAADLCLQVALGEMERMRGAPERAVVYLADAYRATSSPTLDRQHVLATEKLARVVDWAGDHLQAISLIEEVISWDQARSRTMALANDLYFRGVFQLGRRAHHAALADFERSRALVPSGLDPVGLAFLDLQTCATLVELGAVGRAKALCNQADHIFGQFGEMAQAQARLLLARIAIAQGQSITALPVLNQLLANKDALSSFAGGPLAYRLRAQINRQLGKPERAYEDVDAYLNTVDRQRSSDQARQSAVLRARFDADRSAARNQELRERLTLAYTREREQAKRYAILAISAATGILLLLVILGMGIYHRRKLTKIANTDPLTGLLNRRFVNEHKKSLIEGHARSGASLTVAIVDIDHFKSINDNYGHSAGDEVLVAFASTMRDLLRKCDVIARWGGEEFIVIFPHTAQTQAVLALERVRAALASPVATAAGPVIVQFSAGVASFAGIGDLHTLAQQADEALYQAKTEGRDRIKIAQSTNLHGNDASIGIDVSGTRYAAAPESVAFIGESWRCGSPMPLWPRLR